MPTDFANASLLNGVVVSDDQELGDAELGGQDHHSGQHVEIMHEMHRQLRAACRVVSSLKMKTEELALDKARAEDVARDMRTRLISAEQALVDAHATIAKLQSYDVDRTRPLAAPPGATPTDGAERVAGPSHLPPVDAETDSSVPPSGAATVAAVASAAAAAEHLAVARNLSRHKRELELSTLRCAGLQACIKEDDGELRDKIMITFIFWLLTVVLGSGGAMAAFGILLSQTSDRTRTAWMSPLLLPPPSCLPFSLSVRPTFVPAPPPLVPHPTPPPSPPHPLPLPRSSIFGRAPVCARA